MNTEKTLCILKPNAINKNIIGKIINQLEENKLKIIAIKMIKLTYQQAENFYYEHFNKPFLKELIKFIISAPIIPLVIEGKNAISKNRKIIGDTNPKKAKTNTIRSKYGDTILKNTIHGSDSIESANKEILFFFKKSEIFSKKYK